MVTTRRQHGEKIYETHLLRRSYREDGKVKNQTLANLSHLPPQALLAVKAALRGQVLIGADEAVEISRSLPHGHVAAVMAQAHALGLPALLGPGGRQRDLALGLIVARVCEPVSSSPLPAGGPTPHSRATSGSPTRAPMRCTPRWTGWSPSRTRSKRSWRAGT